MLTETVATGKDPKAVAVCYQCGSPHDLLNCAGEGRAGADARAGVAGLAGDGASGGCRACCCAAASAGGTSSLAWLACRLPARPPALAAPGCKMVRFCGRECQVAAWGRHKAECKAEQRRRAAAEAAGGSGGGSS